MRDRCGHNPAGPASAIRAGSGRYRERMPKQRVDGAEWRRRVALGKGYRQLRRPRPAAFKPLAAAGVQVPAIHAAPVMQTGTGAT